MTIVYGRDISGLIMQYANPWGAVFDRCLRRMMLNYGIRAAHGIMHVHEYHMMARRKTMGFIHYGVHPLLQHYHHVAVEKQML